MSESGGNIAMRRDATVLKLLESGWARDDQWVCYGNYDSYVDDGATCSVILYFPTAGMRSSTF